MLKSLSSSAAAEVDQPNEATAARSVKERAAFRGFTVMSSWSDLIYDNSIAALGQLYDSCMTAMCSPAATAKLAPCTAVETPVHKCHPAPISPFGELP